MPLRKAPDSDRSKFVDVALPIPVRSLFTYRMSEDISRAALPGARVLVPFGKRTLTGYAISFADELKLSLKSDETSVRDVIELIDDIPLLTPEILWLTEWAADYYAASWGEMLKASLPAGINANVDILISATENGRVKLEADAPGRAVKWKVLGEVIKHGETTLSMLESSFGESAAKRAYRELLAEELVSSHTRSAPAAVRPKRQKTVRSLDADRSGPFTEPQTRILAALDDNGGELLFTELLREADVGASPINTLAKRGLIEIAVEEVLRDPLKGQVLAGKDDLKLNAEQAFVLSEITNSVRHEEYRAFLLHGVTGSGKTEVYIRAMQQSLALGRGSLMLVPEISLTPIFSRRLKNVFGEQVAILHSSLSPGERFDEWRRIRAGNAMIVIGTRSAIFAPLKDIGLIIVDEEHDASYRQNESPFYNARDLAVIRSNHADAVVVLGSATPSLESFHNAKSGKYQYLQLQKRIGDRPMAVAELIDMREVFQRAGKDVVVSDRLLGAIRETHEKGEQTIILLNRRGFSSFVLCRSCGESLRCANCDITLTYHRQQNKLICHYCNYSVATPKQCPFCESEFLYFVGQGTEQLEGILEKRFPELRIARVDRDAMKRKGEIDRTLLAFDRGEIDMLVGTQMLAKGHDFHNVTLVGVISVDIGLGLPDFRSAERTFQLLTQVAGRAGRGDLPGRVLIQTYYPDHYALRYAVEQNYEKFYDHEIRFRQRMSYPPFVALASIMVTHRDLAAAQRNAAILKDSLTLADGGKSCRILGPAFASVTRLKNEYRLQIIIRSASRRSLRDVIEEGLKRAEVSGGGLRHYRIEIDPINLM